MQLWETLKCTNCQQGGFVRVTELRFHPTGGMSEAPGGWQCGHCGETVNMQKLVQSAKMKVKEAELKTLQDEIKAEISPT